MIYPGDEHAAVTAYVRKFDAVQFIIDHVGMGVERARLCRSSSSLLSTSFCSTRNIPM